MRQTRIVWDNHVCLPLLDAGVDVVTVNIGDSRVPLETLIGAAATTCSGARN